MKSFGYETTSSLIWTYENDPRVIAYIFLLSASLMAGGWFMLDDKKSIRRIYRHSGRLVADFIILDGLPITLFNMGSLGIFASAYILITGGTINGATMGGILTIIGFGAFGKHLRNVVPVIGGVYLGMEHLRPKRTACCTVWYSACSNQRSVWLAIRCSGRILTFFHGLKHRHSSWWSQLIQQRFFGRYPCPDHCSCHRDIQKTKRSFLNRKELKLCYLPEKKSPLLLTS